MSELLMCCRCKQAKGFDIYRVTRMGELAMCKWCGQSQDVGGMEIYTLYAKPYEGFRKEFPKHYPITSKILQGLIAGIAGAMTYGVFHSC